MDSDSLTLARIDSFSVEHPNRQLHSHLDLELHLTYHQRLKCQPDLTKGLVEEDRNILLVVTQTSDLLNPALSIAPWVSASVP